MKLLIIINKLFMLLSIFYIIGCGDSENDSNPTEASNNENNIIEITHDIEKATTWESNNIYVIKKWDFYVMNTLTIEEGTIIKFTDDGPSLTLGENGTIIADGSSTEHIIFTSYKDDAHGGDTNGDNKATSPAQNDWGNINTNSYNGSIFNYCDFYYGGDGSNSSTLYLFDSKVTITNCTFAHNNGGTTNFQDECVLEGSYAAAGTIIKNNIFYDNQKKPCTAGFFYIRMDLPANRPNRLTRLLAAAMVSGLIFAQQQVIYHGVKLKLLLLLTDKIFILLPVLR